MASLNKIFLIGNLTREPELRYTPSGLAVASFTMAINRNFTTQSGEKKETVTFMRVVVWGKRAEVCGEYLNKGSQVFVEGHIQNRSWQAQDGTKRNTTEVIASNVQFLGAPRGSGASAQKQYSAQEPQEPLDLGPDIPDIDISPEESKSVKNNGQEQDDKIPF